MKYFICTLGTPEEAHQHQNFPQDTIQVGIPTMYTERIIPVTKTQAVGYETENEEVSVSLPVLFQQKNTHTPHGVVLRTDRAVKTVLLTPRIERDLEIPEERLHRLPAVFDGLSRYFRGVYFDKENLIYILNTEKIMEGKRD